MKSCVLLLLPLFFCVTLAQAVEEQRGTVVTNDPKQGSMVIKAGVKLMVVHYRAFTEVIIDGKASKADDIKEGMGLSIRFSGPGQADVIKSFGHNPVGVWKWFNDRAVKLDADGTMSADKDRGEWSWVDEESRVLKVKWPGGSIDTLTLSMDAMRLEGSNLSGMRISAERK